MTAVFLRWQKQTQHHSKHTNKNKWHDKLINILSFQASSISCMCHSFCTSMIHRSIQELRRVNWHLANHVLIMSYPEALLGWCLGFSLCLTLWLCLWLRLHLWTGGTTCICSGLMWMKMLAGELGGFDRLVLPPNHQKKRKQFPEVFCCACIIMFVFGTGFVFKFSIRHGANLRGHYGSTPSPLPVASFSCRAAATSTATSRSVGGPNLPKRHLHMHYTHHLTYTLDTRNQETKYFNFCGFL